MVFGVSLLWFFSLIFGAIAYFTYRKHARILEKARRTTGVVVDYAEISAGEGEAWVPLFELSEFSSRRISLWAMGSGHVEKRFPKGSTHEVYFNPTEPEYVYQVGWRAHSSALGFGAFAFVTFVFGLLGLFFGGKG